MTQWFYLKHTDIILGLDQQTQYDLQFTKEIETKGTLNCLDLKMHRKTTSVSNHSIWKSTVWEQYIHAKSAHSSQVKLFFFKSALREEENHARMYTTNVTKEWLTKRKKILQWFRKAK